MKKIVSLILVMLICFSLFGCANREKTIEEKIDNILDSDLYSRVYYGNYNGKEIEWIVIRNMGKKTLLLSANIIEERNYHQIIEEITWENCDLREWLNNDFLNQAFSQEEQKYIQNADVPKTESIRYGTDGGNSTKDKVHILSYWEYQNYGGFSTDFDEMWWLRSPITRVELGYDEKVKSTHYYGAVIDPDGKHQEGVLGCDISWLSENGLGSGVRPAIWIYKR